MKLIETIFEERILYELSKLGSNLLNGFIITTSNDVLKIISDDSIKKAMFYLYKRHPLLQCHIHKTKFLKKIYFAVPENNEERKSIQDMKFEKVKIESRNELVNLLEKFDAELFDYDNKCLMFKLRVFEWKQNDKIAFVFSITVPHCISDGINITTLCIEFVNILNSILQNKECNEMSEHLNVIDTFENLIETSNIITDEMVERYRQRKKEKVAIFRSPEKLANISVDAGAKINLLLFDEVSTKKLIGYAKANQIKLNSVFTVAMLNSFKELYKENDIEFPKDLNLFLPVSLRHRLKPSIDNSNVRICVLGDFLTIRNFGECKNLIEEARNVGNLLNADLNDGLIYDLMLDQFLKFARKAMEYIGLNLVNKFLPFIFPSNYGLSNIGTYATDMQKVIDGPLEIEEIYFGDISGGIVSIYSLCLFVLTFNNKLMFRLSTNRKLFDSHYSDRFMVLFEQKLKNFLD